MLNLTQSDCRHGGVAFAAGEDLSLKAGFLVKLNSGKDLILPTGDQDITPYVITQGADQGYLCGAVPLSSAVNARVELFGTCDAGVLLVAKGDGRVTAYTAGSAALVIGVAEEPGIGGQHVLLRPVSIGVKGADGEAGTAGAAGPAGAAGAAGRDAGVVVLPRASVTGSIPSNAVGYVAMWVNGEWSFNFDSVVEGRKHFAVVADDGVLLEAVALGGFSGVLAGSDLNAPVSVPAAAFLAGTPTFAWYVGGTPDGMGPTYMMLTVAGMDIDLSPLMPVLRVASVAAGTVYISA